MKKLIATCCLLFPLAGCFEAERQTQELASKLRQQEQFIRDYQEQVKELADLKGRVLAIQKIFSGVLQRLDRLDERLYQGRHIKSLRDRNAASQELIDGYISLIDQLERDIPAK